MFVNQYSVSYIDVFGELKHEEFVYITLMADFLNDKMIWNPIIHCAQIDDESEEAEIMAYSDKKDIRDNIGIGYNEYNTEYRWVL
jgi:hypothetical protein